MRILHTADLHLGQVLYQNYTREDEHDHFFRQLEEWCRSYHPDALLVSGDIFDIQQPGATTKRRFNEYFVSLHNAFPQMAVVITAGNHDSASRIHADNVVWSLGNVKLVGLPPAADSLSRPDGWQQDYVVEIPQGYVIAMPFVTGTRKDIVQALLDYVAQRNSAQKPVVLMGHMAVSGSDFTGHGFDIGHLQTVAVSELGTGFDYMALGHIHRPQTIGHADEHEPVSTYPAGVVRYSGSPLHVSCDEKFPHSVSLVDIDRHGGTVTVTGGLVNGTAQSGETVTFTATPDEEFTLAAVSVTTATGQNVEFIVDDSGINSFVMPAEAVTISATFEASSPSYLLGDVNNDGDVTIKDVTSLIDYLLSGSGDINMQAADCSNDGSVTIKDVTALIDYLLSGTWP